MSSAEQRRSGPSIPTRTAAEVTSPDLNSNAILAPRADVLSDLDAMAEQLQGYIVVQVCVDDEGHRRTYLYRSAVAAERAVKRASERGRRAHVSLVQMVPVGVVVEQLGGRP